MNTPAINNSRIQSIDLLRGLVMVIMALDHTRDFFHKDAWVQALDPTNMATTTPALFFTRWITHFCAPLFVFLAGTSGWLQAMRKSKKELSVFLITRGLWLVLIEITVVNLSFSFDIHFMIIGLQTIWSIGISMIILGLMIWLPFYLILALGLIIVFGHNSLDFYESQLPKGPFGPVTPGWEYDILHHIGFYHLWGNHYLFIFYPFLSWAGLMMLGYCFGKVIADADEQRRRSSMLYLGLGIIVLFVVVRYIDIYGDPDHWQTQDRGWIYTILSFFNTHKYPPSLLYMCMTIGPGILFLRAFYKTKNRFTDIISVYGRVPFFYYIFHFYLIHFVSMLFFLGRGHSFESGLSTNPQQLLPNFVVPGEGVDLW
ncbi:MAG TPA: heparan-alpha-glucosaminide N-acetyltransferase domain-containing protein, partial [Ferruginibacter sp.]|nr:heparan-alpha-glucosaminide N-acetyltransferase domain-containing protein [Ferruginibacter sp.]